MRHPLRRTLLLLAGVALLGAACGDGGSPTEGAPGKDEARVGFALDVAGTSVNAISVEVTAPDITSRLLFNIEVVNGVATGSITIPAGADRTITARAYDAKGILTHQGSRVVTVRGGTNTSVTITLVPTAGEQPLTINFGAMVVQVTRAAPPPPDRAYEGDEVGDTVRYRAAVRNADGTAVTGKVRWASLNPAIATVDSMGLVTARRPGQVEIAATYQGAGGTAMFTVLGDGTDGSVDETAPKITGLTFSADSFNITASDTVLNITVSAADAGSGVASLSVHLYAPSTGATTNRQGQSCYANAPGGTTPPPTNAVSWTCKISFSRYNAGGRWNIDYVRIFDRNDNYRLVRDVQLAASGFKSTVKVANSNADVTGPAVTGISIAPDSLNLTTGADTIVTVTVAASDAGAGVETLTVSFSNQPGTLTRYCIANRYTPPNVPPTGTGTNQVAWSCRIHIPRTSAAATYTAFNVHLHDRLGNTGNYHTAQIAAAGWESSFKVVK